jgi:hypothetical protein
MTAHIPTVQDLSRKTIHELHAMFQSAASISADAEHSEAERFPAERNYAPLDVPQGTAVIWCTPGVPTAAAANRLMSETGRLLPTNGRLA